MFSLCAGLATDAIELVEDFGVPCPNYVKIDAPGASEDIIAGAVRTFRRPEVRQIHLELCDTSEGAQRILEMLNQNGFVPVGKNVHGGSADVTFARRAWYTEPAWNFPSTSGSAGTITPPPR